MFVVRLFSCSFFSRPHPAEMATISKSFQTSNIIQKMKLLSSLNFSSVIPAACLAFSVRVLWNLRMNIFWNTNRSFLFADLVGCNALSNKAKLRGSQTNWNLCINDSMCKCQLFISEGIIFWISSLVSWVRPHWLLFVCFPRKLWLDLNACSFIVSKKRWQMGQFFVNLRIVLLVFHFFRSRLLLDQLLPFRKTCPQLSLQIAREIQISKCHYQTIRTSNIGCVKLRRVWL